MTKISEHLDGIEQALLLNPTVFEFTITRRWTHSDAGYIRLRAVLTNGDLLEAAEYVELNQERVVLEDYRHQWMSGDHQLRRRWDCTPHHPEVSTHPHHCHVGPEGSIEPSTPLSIIAVLEWIETYLRETKT